MMDKLKGVVIGVGVVVVLAAGGAAVAGASGDDNATDKALTGSALDRASTAALAHVGGGKVTGTELGDEDGYYEVEVTKPGGGQVDVALDRGFHVLGAKDDGDNVEHSD